MTALAEQRELKDAFFRSAHSPLSPAQRKAFRGLRYFPENAALRFQVPLHKHAEPLRLQMQTSTGSAAEFLRHAEVRFTVSGMPQVLQVYKSTDHGGLFLPFTDATTRIETYAAGRYLDLEEEPDESVLLDFNLAYNPYCAYNENWSCPLPPAENRLAVRIEAGEQNFLKD